MNTITSADVAKVEAQFDKCFHIGNKFSHVYKKIVITYTWKHKFSSIEFKAWHSITDASNIPDIKDFLFLQLRKMILSLMTSNGKPITVSGYDGPLKVIYNNENHEIHVCIDNNSN